MLGRGNRGATCPPPLSPLHVPRGSGTMETDSAQGARMQRSARDGPLHDRARILAPTAAAAAVLALSLLELAEFGHLLV